jgi:hypothetical protein
LQGTQKFTRIGIFGLKTYHLATLGLPHVFIESAPLTRDRVARFFVARRSVPSFHFLQSLDKNLLLISLLENMTASQSLPPHSLLIMAGFDPTTLNVQAEM